MDSPAALTTEEVTRLQRCINDLVSVLAFPATWIGRDPAQIVSFFLDGLLRVLALEVAYVRMTEEHGTGLEDVRLSHDTGSDSSGVSQWFAALGDDPDKWPRQMMMADGSAIAVQAIRLGLHSGAGLVAAGSRRRGFPLQTEQLLLNVAANQLLVGLQGARLREAQKREVEELEERAARVKLQQVLDTIPVIAWCNLPDGPNEFLNKRWREYTGMTPEDSHGWGWHSAFHQDDLPPLMKQWAGMIDSGEPGEIAARIRRHDGVYRWFLIRAEPFHDEAGQLIRWYGTSTDIDDRKRAEEALLDNQRELANVTRVTSLGVLTASIAHEVNQPLSGIITNAGACLRMLSGQPPNIDGALETVRRTLRDGKRAADVITRLRTLYTRKDPDSEPMDLSEAAREVVSLWQGELQRERVVVRLELAGNLPPVNGDRVQLQQVILNLLRNASDAMRTIEDRPRKLLIRTEPDDAGTVRLSVSDSGVGFMHHPAEKAFEPFYTTKSDGMGIGLSVSRSIIEAHHGRLWATPNEGPGVTFAFSLPCLPDHRE